jgi:beta-lactamase class A
MVRLAAAALVGTLVLAAGALFTAELHGAPGIDSVAAIGKDAAAGVLAVRDHPPAPPAQLPTAGPIAERMTGIHPHPGFARLQVQVGQLLDGAGATGGVSLIELGNSNPESWNLNGDGSFVAASTYKQPLLMEDAQNVAAGRASPNDLLCYVSGDQEAGYFNDYSNGRCYTRAELERRVGRYSDNTAAHILVRYQGGGAALNAYARAHGATESAFYIPNTTTSNDLARLWANEWAGQAGGAPAQGYLYPLLTNTNYEQGVPAGLPAGTTVVHKVGFIAGNLHDSALVASGPRGPYVLSICTMSSSTGWALLAAISRAVWNFEATR